MMYCKDLTVLFSVNTTLPLVMAYCVSLVLTPDIKLCAVGSYPPVNSQFYELRLEISASQSPLSKGLATIFDRNALGNLSTGLVRKNPII